MTPAEKTIQILLESLLPYRNKGVSVYASSSFQTQSVPLLHILSTHFNWVKILFIDTGYLFAETYEFKRRLADKLNLNIVTVSTNKSYMQQRTSSGLLLYSEDTDRCCHINKVEPVDILLNPGDVWISGVRRDQTAIRKQMAQKEMDKRGVVRIHPMLEWNAKDVYAYIKEHDLPKHPLEKAGFVSIGCVPCTHKWSESATRGGRWVGQQKTECGLHTENR